MRKPTKCGLTGSFYPAPPPRCCRWPSGISCSEGARPMQRASEIRAAGTWNPTTAIDKVVLDADERYRRRIMLTGERGMRFVLDLTRAAARDDGDGLVLENGALVRVAVKHESLFEISAASAHELARLAWHIGNRHTDLQVIGSTLRVR